MLDVAGRTYGLIVGEVKDFVELPPNAVASRAQLPGVDPRIVRAVARRGDEHFVILDIEALFAPMLGS